MASSERSTTPPPRRRAPPPPAPASEAAAAAAPSSPTPRSPSPAQSSAVGQTRAADPAARALMPAAPLASNPPLPLDILSPRPARHAPASAPAPTQQEEEAAYAFYAHSSGALRTGDSFYAPAAPPLGAATRAAAAAAAAAAAITADGASSTSTAVPTAAPFPAPLLALAPGPGSGFRDFMRYYDPRWVWKVSMRAGLCAVDAAGIACAASVLTASAKRPEAFVLAGFLSDAAKMPTAIGMFSISIFLCCLVTVARFLRRPPRPLHPALLLVVDGVLFLALLCLSIVLFNATAGLADFGSDPAQGLPDPGGDQRQYIGRYVLTQQPPAQWSYVVTEITVYNETTGQYSHPDPATTAVVRDCTYAGFATCAAQDAWVNALWLDKGRRLGLDGALSALAVAAAVLHAVMFAWACADVHRRRRDERAFYIVNEILAEMEEQGVVTFDRARRRELDGTATEVRAPGPVAATADLVYGVNGALVPAPRWMNTRAEQRGPSGRGA